MGLKPNVDADSTTWIGLTDDALLLAITIMKMYETEFRQFIREVRKQKGNSLQVKTQRDENLYVVMCIDSLRYKCGSIPEIMQVTVFGFNKTRTLVSDLIISKQLRNINVPATGRGRPKLIYVLYDDPRADVDIIDIWKKLHGIK